MNKNVLNGVQKQKIKETQVYLTEWINIKEGFFKQHIPIQHKLMKNLEGSAEITMLRLRQAVSILKQQREIQLLFIQKFQKSFLNDQKRFQENIKIHSSKRPSKKQSQNQSEQQAQIIWSSNIDKVFNCMSNSHKKRMTDLQEFVKALQKCEYELTQQESRYQAEVKKIIKNLQKWLQKIDASQKQQEATVKNILKDSKNKERDGGFYLLEYKKLQVQIQHEFTTFAERGKLIFNLMKTILDRQKNCSQKFRQILDYYFKVKNTIFKENQFDERFLGSLIVMEDNVVESRKLFFNKYLLTQDQMEIIKTLVPHPHINGPTPLLECIIRYLKLQSEDFLTKINSKNKLDFFLANLSYKKWQNAALAKGWLITSYVPVCIYLTYDYTLSIMNATDNELVRKVNAKFTKIKKIQSGNIVFLEETISGFFSDGKEEYQIKFENQDNMEEFIEFIKNQDE